MFFGCCFCVSYKSFPSAGVSWSVDEQALDIVKGWTRASVVMTFLLAASELDLQEAATGEKLKPLHKVLDRCWMIPCHVAWCVCPNF